jgi:hypothetical protein
MDSTNVQGFNKELGCELREHLQQLDYLLNSVQEAEARFNSTQERSASIIKQHGERIISEGLSFESNPYPDEATITQEEFNNINHAMFEIKLFTECFYYLAGRIRSMLRHKEVPLPGLEKFEALGVRNVRNQLLEHPEGANSRVFINSWGFGASHGPVLKALRYEGQEQIFPDNGLYSNALEMKQNMESFLQQVIQGHGDNLGAH